MAPTTATPDRGPAATNWRRPSLTACCAWLLCLLATTMQGATQHLPALLLRLVALAAAGAGLAMPAQRRPALALPLGALVVVGIAAMAAPQPGLAAQAFVSVASVVLLYLAFGSAAATTALMAWQTALGLALVHAVWAMLDVAMHHSRATAGFFNPNDLGAALAPFVVSSAADWAASSTAAHADTAPTPMHGPRRIPFDAALPMTLSGRLGGCRQPKLVCCLLTLGCLASGSRAAIVAILLGLLIVGLGRYQRRGVSLALAALSLVSAAAVVLYARGASDPYRFSRWAIWRRCLSIGWHHPFGSGLAAFESTLRQAGVALPGLVRYPYLANHAHNEVLHAWVELGVVGAALVVAAGIFAARQACCSPSPAKHLAILTAFALPALCSNTLHIPPIALCAALWASCLTPAAGRGWPGRRWAPAATLLFLLPALPAALTDTCSRTAMALAQAGQPAAAAHFSEAARAISPWSVAAHLLHQRLAAQLGKPWASVEADLQSLAARAPHDPRPLLRAATWFEQGLKPTAPPQDFIHLAHLWQQAAGADPHNALAWAAAGKAWRRAGRQQQARAAWQQALQQEPHCARALMGLATLTTANSSSQQAFVLKAQEAAQKAVLYRGYAANVLTLAP